MSVDRDAPLEWFLEHRHAEIALFVMTLEPTPACPEPGTPAFFEVLREHFVFWWELEERGVLLGAGPTADGRGLAILRCSSLEEARHHAAEEPFGARGFRTNTVAPWQLNEGTLVALLRDH